MVSQRHTMLADDVFRARLDDIVARLRDWSARHSDCARIEETRADRFWRMSAEPQSRSACAFELILHRDQHFDLAVGPEVYERQPLDDPAIIPLLVEAICEGRAVTRTLAGYNTGAVRSVETEIRLRDGRQWRRVRLVPPIAEVLPADECQTRDHHYTPYRLR